MKNQNEKPEQDTSRLEEAYRDSKTVSAADLIELRESASIWTIVVVKDRAMKPYILLGDPDKPDTRMWVEFNGETKETLTKYHSFVTKCQEIMRDKSRSPEELDTFRQVVVSCGIIGSFVFKNDPSVQQSLFGNALTAIALSWYRKDNPSELSDDDIIGSPEFAVTFGTVVEHFKLFTNTCVSVVNSEDLFANTSPDDK